MGRLPNQYGKRKRSASSAPKKRCPRFKAVTRVSRRKERVSDKGGAALVLNSDHTRDASIACDVSGRQALRSRKKGDGVGGGGWVGVRPSAHMTGGGLIRERREVQDTSAVEHYNQEKKEKIRQGRVMWVRVRPGNGPRPTTIPWKKTELSIRRRAPPASATRVLPWATFPKGRMRKDTTAIPRRRPTLKKHVP